MDLFFKPRGIAVVGATANPHKGGNSILKNLLRYYKGKIYPVNPKYDAIEGLPCYASIRDIPGPADLAMIFVPARQVLAAVEESAAHGIPRVMILSSGFGESGENGEALQQKLISLVRKSALRVWGPNCMGMVDTGSGHIFSFMNPDIGQSMIRGNISLIVQSGLLAAGFLMDIVTHGLGAFNKVCSIGNKSDVNECDLLPYLLDDPGTEAVGLYLESIPEGRRFVEICRRSAKPIVVLKGGKSSNGAKAAMSHTASLAGNHRLIEGALAQAGVFEAIDFRQMVDLCRSLAMYPVVPSGSGRVATLTYSGGAGIVGVDFMAERDVSVAELSPDSKKALCKYFPDWMAVENPIDIWPAFEKHAGTGVDVYRESLQVLLRDPGVDAVLLFVLVGVFGMVDPAEMAKMSRKTGKPVLVWIVGDQPKVLDYLKEARKVGILAFQELYRAVECLAVIFRRGFPGFAFPASCSVTEEKPPRCPPQPDDLQETIQAGEGPLDEFLSKRILQAQGIQVVEEQIVETPEACIAAAARLGYPVVMKGLIPGGVHKTEMGLVKLDVQSAEEALAVFRDLMKQMEFKGKLLVQRQIRGTLELIMGLVRDPQFGPCVMFGLGGIFAEAFRDTAFAMAPLTMRDALNVIARIKGQRLLDGFRGMPRVNRDEIAGILMKLGEIALRHERIGEIDINPLIVTQTGAVAVDATVIIDTNLNDCAPQCFKSQVPGFQAG